ncbi:MAG: FMN-binding protein [bacterium]
MEVKLRKSLAILVCFVVSVVILTMVNIYTAPLIAQTETRTYIDNLKKVINAFEFIPVVPETVYQAFDSTKKLQGIVFKVWSKGYGGVIPITVGVGTDLRITKIYIGGKIEGFKETEGIGSKVRSNTFTDQFIGKDISQISLQEDGGRIDAITGATISSRAVCEGIKKGLRKYASFLSKYEPEDPKYQIFPEAKNFVEIMKDTLWIALAYPETLGIVFSGQTFGYLDTIKYLAGMRKKGLIERIIITYSQETEGIGEQIRNPEFLEKFKTGIPDAISGATISSQALIKSVQLNIEKYKNYLK